MDVLFKVYDAHPPLAQVLDDIKEIVIDSTKICYTLPLLNLIDDPLGLSTTKQNVPGCKLATTVRITV